MSNSAVASESPTRITAVRHGETAWNAVTRLQGQLDIDLNDLGRWQAERAGAALADSALQVIYSSDLCRAHHTAQAIARHSGIAPPDIRTHPGLRERCFGRFEDCGGPKSQPGPRWRGAPEGTGGLSLSVHGR